MGRNSKRNPKRQRGAENPALAGQEVLRGQDRNGLTSMRETDAATMHGGLTATRGSAAAMRGGAVGLNEAGKPELLMLSGSFENWLAQPLVLPLGRAMTTFASMGRIPWPGYMSPCPERRDTDLIGTFAPEMAEGVSGDAGLVGVFNDVFQLKAPDKLVTEAEKTLVRMRLEKFAEWLPQSHIDKRWRNKHYVVSRRAAVAAYLMNYNTLRRMLIPGGEIICSGESIRCEWLVPAWLLFGEELAQR